MGRLGMARLATAGRSLRGACLIVGDAIAYIVREFGDQGSPREGCCELVAVG